MTAGPAKSERRNLRIGRTGAHELAEGYAGMGASEDPRKQGRVRGAPAVRFARHRYVLDPEKASRFVEPGDGPMRARIDAEDRHALSLRSEATNSRTKGSSARVPSRQ
jgi:hypothetical protein